jgi:hypothetical protein
MTALFEARSSISSVSSGPRRSVNNPGYGRPDLIEKQNRKAVRVANLDDPRPV